MTPQDDLRLGDLQLRIMRVLWQAGPSTVADVHAALPEPRLAYTTVATMLRKMEDRGLVGHDEDPDDDRGRRFVFRAVVPQHQVTRSIASDLVKRVFEGDLANAVSHLLEVREVSPEELDELERLIQARREVDAS